jgi:hypothetical protein
MVCVYVRKDYLSISYLACPSFKVTRVSKISSTQFVTHLVYYSDSVWLNKSSKTERYS